MALERGINISSMKINLSDKIIAWLALLSGLTISAVAIWYSVAGLVSIFAAAVIPIIVMGVALEISKLIATVWLKLNWSRAPVFIRTYLLVAIAILMVITSMGIFGFLSKAHSDAGLVSGDVMAKISVYDEKIKTAKDNIDANRKALKQMDEAVDQIMGRSSDEKGADKAVQIRRSQAKERGRLQAEIAAEQKTIASLNEARAPIAAEVRKVEAEVGPIKYIANFIYGDNPDANILEKAVTWVIIIIVSVFDPLAVILLLSSQYSFQWFRQAREEQPAEGDSPPEPEPVVDNQPLTVTEQPIEDDFKFFAEYEPEPIPCVKCGTPLTEVPSIGLVCANPECDPPVQEVLEEEEKENSETEENEILESVLETEKQAMKSWKHDNPDSSLKSQKRLFEKGVIKKLPWDDYLKPQEDFADEAAIEAAKWAQEQLEKSTEAYMENVDGHQVKKIIEGYQQNAEQNESTIWQRVKKAKE
jgi:uncharacterized Zn finger protein (UPF0148 family)